MSERKIPTLPDDAARIAALERAVDHFESQGSPLKAIAACKRILLVDPDHPGTRDRIDALCARLHGAEPGPAAGAPVGLSRGAPLDDLVLEDVIDETPPIALDADLTAQPMVEIELDWKQTCDDDARRWAADTLPRTPLFSSLDAESLRLLVDGARLIDLPADHELFHQGDPGNALFVIAEGAVVPVAEGETRKKLAVLEEGDFFGEISLVTERPRSATIEALVDTKLLAIDRSLVAELVEKEPKVLRVLLRYLRDRLIDRLLRTSDFFTGLPAPQREAVARRFRFIEMADGAILIRQDQQSPGLFALLSGRVDVIHSDGVGDKRLATLGSGDVFGEMSMLTGEPAVASCVANGKCWALALPRADFERLAAEEAAVHDAVAALAESRRSANESSLFDAPYLDGQMDLL
ncbi:MAG: cyclic nucleotide-binding domain-containing protein [Myxococcales bacterium]|nr:cyclic nucleotide-binding domain-containing protein [Myxococcales bacterium]